MRASSRPARFGRAAAVDIARSRNAIPVGLARSPGIRIEEQNLLPATASVGAQSGAFGEHRDGLLPLPSRDAGRHRVVRAPDEA